MIYVVTHHDFARTVWTLKREAGRGELEFIRPLTYRSLFIRQRAPIGHYIFTDFDRLSAYEIQVADTIARRVREAAPEARILNRPVLALERYPLLRRLAALRINDFSAYRLDSGEMPRKYPVFVRCEDDCREPDTPLLHSEAELVAAVSALQAAGMPAKRRIAVEFCAAPDSDGFYRKYGVFKIGRHLVPHHLFHSTDWYVKRHARHRGEADPFRDEVLRFLQEMPHAAAIERAFAEARIDFGRIDYAVVGGRVQTYEINTNPTFPPIALATARPGSKDRRTLIHDRMLQAFREIDAPLSRNGTVGFSLPTPRMQKFDALPLRARWVAFYERVRLAVGA